MTYEAVTLREYGVIEEIWGSENVIRGWGDVDESRTRRREDRRVGVRLFGGDGDGDGDGEGDGDGDGDSDGYGDIERYN